jgi:predicted TIM-barrel fold metal-dependent hydrolase
MHHAVTTDTHHHLLNKKNLKNPQSKKKPQQNVNPKTHKTNGK